MSGCGVETTRGRLARSLQTRQQPITPTAALGVVGVAIGFWYLGGPVGVAGAVTVAVLWYSFSGVYGFATGQVFLATVVPARLTPELVAVETALVVVLVGPKATARGSIRPAVAIVVTLVGVAVGVGVVSEYVSAPTIIGAAICVGFALFSVVLSLRQQPVDVGVTGRTGAEQ